MKKSIVYILIAVVSSYGIRFLLHEGIRRNEEGIYGKFNTVFRKQNNFDVVFFGSSRAETHFDCRIFDSINRTHSYNAGMEGASIEFTWYILKAYLKNSHKPKTIVLSIDHVFNFERDDTVFMYPRYFPYLQNEDLYTGIKKIDKRFWSFRCIPFYSMAHMGQKYLHASLRGWLKKGGSQDSLYQNGFFSFSDKTFVPGRVSEKRADYDVRLDAYVDSIALFCKKEQIKLVTVISPVHSSFYNATVGVEQNVEALRVKCNKFNADLYNYAGDAFCNDNSLFYDGFHLNGRGARSFTLRFSVDYNNKSGQNPF